MPNMGREVTEGQAISSAPRAEDHCRIASEIRTNGMRTFRFNPGLASWHLGRSFYFWLASCFFFRAGVRVLGVEAGTFFFISSMVGESLSSSVTSMNEGDAGAVATTKIVGVWLRPIFWPSS